MPRARASQSQAMPSTQADSDDETQASQTQNLTQANKMMTTLSKAEKDRKVNDLVQYLLIMDQKKFPIKRQDINKSVLKENSKGFPIFMREAKEVLAKVFGFDLVELKGKQKTYILVNQYQTEQGRESVSENQRTGLLMVILSSIFMNGNVMADNTLYHTLRKLGIQIDRPHPVFHDVKKLLTEFGRQQYLETTRIPNSDPPSFEYRWGQRAKLELSKRKCLDFVSELYGMNDPSAWTSQWQDILRTEGAQPLGEDAADEDD